MTALTLTLTLSRKWDDFLLRDFERDHSKVDFSQVIDPEWENEEETWTFEVDQPAEPKDDPAFVLSRDLDRRRRRHEHAQPERDGDCGRDIHEIGSF